MLPAQQTLHLDMKKKTKDIVNLHKNNISEIAIRWCRAMLEVSSSRDEAKAMSLIDKKKEG